MDSHTPVKDLSGGDDQHYILDVELEENQDETSSVRSDSDIFDHEDNSDLDEGEDDDEMVDVEDVAEGDFVMHEANLKSCTTATPCISNERYQCSEVPQIGYDRLTCDQWVDQDENTSENSLQQQRLEEQRGVKAKGGAEDQEDEEAQAGGEGNRGVEAMQVGEETTQGVDGEGEAEAQGDVGGQGSVGDQLGIEGQGELDILGGAEDKGGLEVQGGAKVQGGTEVQGGIEIQGGAEGQGDLGDKGGLEIQGGAEVQGGTEVQGRIEVQGGPEGQGDFRDKKIVADQGGVQDEEEVRSQRSHEDQGGVNRGVEEKTVEESLQPTSQVSHMEKELNKTSNSLKENSGLDPMPFTVSNDNSAGSAIDFTKNTTQAEQLSGADATTQGSEDVSRSIGEIGRLETAQGSSQPCTPTICPLPGNDGLTDSDPLSLNHIQPFNVNLPLNDSTRGNSYLYSSQHEVFEQMMMDAQDMQNLDIPSNLMKNRDVDSLVAAHLMTSLARGDLSFDQHSTGQTFPQSTDHPTFHDLDRSYSQEQNGGYPIADQNNNMYGNDFSLQDVHNGNNVMPNQNNNVVNSYFDQGLGDGRSTDPVYDSRRHSYPGNDIGQGEGQGHLHGDRFQGHQRTRSEPSGNLWSVVPSAFGPVLQSSQTMTEGNQNLIQHPQPCYPQGNPQIQQNHSDSGSFYNEPFLPIENQNGHLLSSGDQEPGAVRHTKAKRQLIDAESNTDAVLILSDESDSLSPGRVNEFSKCPFDDDFDDDPEYMPSMPKRHRKSYPSSTISSKGQDNVIDRLYFSNEGLTREKPQRKVSRRKRKHVSRVPTSFFNFLAPDMNTKEVDSIDHKSLIAKYIDYLLLENEHITEMSKSVSVTIENCVMDDPYLMDIIKVKIPFPTPKYLQWLKVYYPQIQVDWDAVNNELSTYIPDSKGQKKRTYYLDSRPFPVLLGESFYFFQREKDRTTMNPVNNMQ